MSAEKSGAPAQPTPGNWFVDREEDEGGFTISTDLGQIIGVVHSSVDFPCIEHIDEEARANARLFATAKDLRAILAEMIDVYGSDDGAGPIDVIERAKAIVARTEDAQ